MHAPRKRDALTRLVKVATALGLLAFFAARIGWRQVWSDLASADYRWILVAAATYVLGIVVQAVRWQVLLKSLGGEVGLIRLTALRFVGRFFNIFLPTGIGGDVVRVMEVTRDVPGPAAVSSLMTDRALGLLSTSLLALVAWPFTVRGDQPALKVMGTVVGGITLGLVGALWLVTQTRFLKWATERLPLRRIWPGTSIKPGRTGWLRDLVNTFDGYSRRSLSASMAYSLVFGLTNVLTYAFIGLAVRAVVPFSYYLLVSPLITLALLIPLAFNSIGTRDAAYLLLFTPIGVPAATALAMSVIFHALNLLSGLLGGGFYLVMSATSGLVSLKIRRGLENQELS